MQLVPKQVESKEGTVQYTKHYFRDYVTAMLGNINNLIITYGKDNVLGILKYMVDKIERGEYD
jgi:hypothetical protein